MQGVRGRERVQMLRPLPHLSIVIQASSRDRETERQRDRETETDRDRQRQRDRETERIHKERYVHVRV